MQPNFKMKPISIIGTATTQFGELWDVSLQDLLEQVVGDVVADTQRKTGLLPEGIEAVFVANKAASNYQLQHHLGAVVSDLFPHHPPATRIEGACASGGLAMIAAEQALLSGVYKTVLVVGVEKMTDVGSDETTAILSGAAHAEAEYGSTFPALYALLAQEHMRVYGTTRQQLSAVAVQNHAHAVHNPKAQYHKTLTEEIVSSSTMIAEPLRLLDCSPITDGAAAVVLTTLAPQQLPSQPTTEFAHIIGFGQGQDSITLAGRASLTEFAATRKAAQQAYGMAGVHAKDITVAEVHDCFTIAEIFAVEDLGFASKGAAAPAIADETLKVTINPSGGLKGCGHPVGATGVKQIAYLAEHLGDGVGLTHNVGGSGATAVVHILQKGTR